MTASSSINSPPTSEVAFQFLSLDGEALESPREWTEGYVALDVEPSLWEQLRLFRHDQQLPLSLRKVGDEVRIAAEWPFSGAGHYELRLDGPGDLEHRVVWTVEPGKISPQAFVEMLASLDGRLPVSIAIRLQRLGAIAGVKLLPPGETTLAQEMTRLRVAVQGSRHIPGLQATLPEIARDPHRILATSEVSVPRERARRVHPTALARTLAKPHSLDRGGIPLRLPELRVEPTVDVYENRLVKAFHDQVHRRLRRVLPILERSRYTDLAEEARSLLASLALGRRQARFLNEVNPLTHLPNTLTMVLLKNPAYRRALEGYIQFHRSAATRLDDAALEAPLEQLPSLYQTWGVLEVVDELLSLAATHGYEIRRQRIVGRDVGGVFVRVLKDGSAALILQRASDESVVKVIPERSYVRAGRPLRSVSYTQRPDVAVELERPGEALEVYIFDPKYKLDSEVEGEVPARARPKKIDIDTMHAYRDAIRDEMDRRVVRHAAILYPGPYTAFGDGLSALSADPNSPESLRQQIREIVEPALLGA